jgi:hypothetical protein
MRLYGRASRPFLDQAADKFFILSTGHSTTGLDVIVEVTGNNVKMTRPIDDRVSRPVQQLQGGNSRRRGPAVEGGSWLQRETRY